MVDIHSHILPGVDDGARTLDESIAMLRVAAQHGTTDIVATPHANSQFRFNQELIQQRFAEVSKAAQGLVRVHLGCDFHISYENVQDALENPTRYTINNLSYLMVELPDLVMLEPARSILSRLRSARMIPVITHPERNVMLQDKIDTLSQWLEDGCLLQITGQSLLGRFGPEAARCANSLLRRDLVHFIASDAHDCDDRPPRLDEPYRHVALRFGERRAEQLLRINPAMALRGEPLEEQPLTPVRKWFEFWK
ncbi:MAG TPA: CpsB/CapC family capsule biosynthesis tyrosine phosphatase [Bryobacteraceae bacterium]|nr:CpsB/CapC family capsule biosynthesis tyrosine phosphatase [Bryobacteraceae bacterium]